MSKEEKKKQIHEYDPTIFPMKVWVVYDCPVTVLKDMFPPSCNIEWEELGKSADAEVCTATRLKPDRKVGTLIRFRSKAAMTAPVIAHEADHAAFDILEYIGELPDASHQETHAYLVQWITECCLEVRNKY